MGLSATPRVLLVCGALAVAGCLPGPDDVRARYNAELLVFGVEPGDRLELRVADRTLRPAPGRPVEPLTVLLALPVGEQEGTVLRERGALEPRCASFTFHIVDERAMTTTSVDLRNGGECGEAAEPDEHDDGGQPEPGSDAGPSGSGDAGSPEPIRLFSAISETTTQPGECAPDSCTETLSVDASGEVQLFQGESSEAGVAPIADIEALAALVLSPAADALFSDGCESSPQGVRVTLERSLIAADAMLPRQVLESVDVTGCDAPVIGQLRGQLSVLRNTALGE